MKIEIEVEIPEGFEATGEYRAPKAGEWYLMHGRCEADRRTSAYPTDPRVILREKRLRYEDFASEWHVRVDAFGDVLGPTLAGRMTPLAARSLAADLVAAADHVDRVRAQEPNA